MPPRHAAVALLATSAVATSLAGLTGCGGPKPADQACAKGACTLTFHGDGSATTVVSEGGGKVKATIEQLGEPDTGTLAVKFKIDGKDFEARKSVLLDFGKGALVVQSLEADEVVARVILSQR